jgi:hypothetical protein
VLLNYDLKEYKVIKLTVYALSIFEQNLWKALCNVTLRSKIFLVYKTIYLYETGTISAATLLQLSTMSCSSQE